MTDLLLETFWEKVKVDPITSCWNWTASKIREGYGKFESKGKTIYSHRFAYEVNKGKIPEGLHLDHLCRNRSCVNPEHLEAVTQKENLMRGIGIYRLGLWQIRKTHCPQGHEYSKENTYIDRKGSRNCRLCHRLKGRKKVNSLG